MMLMRLDEVMGGVQTWWALSVLYLHIRIYLYASRASSCNYPQKKAFHTKYIAESSDGVKRAPAPISHGNSQMDEPGPRPDARGNLLCTCTIQVSAHVEFGKLSIDLYKAPFVEPIPAAVNVSLSPPCIRQSKFAQGAPHHVVFILESKNPLGTNDSRETSKIHSRPSVGLNFFSSGHFAPAPCPCSPRMRDR